MHKVFNLSLPYNLSFVNIIPANTRSAFVYIHANDVICSITNIIYQSIYEAHCIYIHGMDENNLWFECKYVIFISSYFINEIAIQNHYIHKNVIQTDHDQKETSTQE